VKNTVRKQTNTEKLEEYFLIEYSKQNKPTVSKKKTPNKSALLLLKAERSHSINYQDQAVTGFVGQTLLS
jgi:hypothetical protein